MRILNIQLSDFVDNWIDDRTVDLSDVEELVISGPGEIRFGSFDSSSCKNIKRIIFSDDITGIGDNCFTYSNSVEQVCFGKGLQYIGNMCFHYADSLQEVYIPGSIKIIGHHTFNHCASLHTVEFSEGLERIGYNSFHDCPALDKIVFPYSVYDVGSGVFEHSQWMKEHSNEYAVLGRVLFSTFKFRGRDMDRIEIPDSVEYFIGAGYELGKEVDFGENTKEIPPCFARNSYVLETAVFHDKLEKIGHEAFKYCDRLKQVKIPDSVYYIGSEAFKINQLADVPKKGCVCLGKTVFGWVGEDEEAVIPEGPETISPGAFLNKKKLKKVVIPSTVRTIYNYAFEKCLHLEFVQIPAGVTEIGNGAFTKCSPFTIITTEGSYAEQFAIRNGIPISFVGDEVSSERTAQEAEDLVRILAIKEEGGRHLGRFKPENRTYPVCLAAVADDGSALEYVPEELRTKEIYLAACKASGKMLSYVPLKHINTAICKAAVMSDGLALCFVPEKYRTEQLCLLAVKKNPKAIAYVPFKLVTPKFCVKADCLSSVPDLLRNAEFYNEVTDLDPQAFWFIPKQYRTVAICKKYFTAMGYNSTADAIRQDNRLMGLIHPSLYDHETCVLIVQSPDFRHYATVYGTSYISNPMELMNGSIQLKKLLKYPDVFLQAFDLNIGMIEYVPEKILTPEMLMKLMEINYMVFPKIPEDLRSEKICGYAIAKNPEFIKYVPVSLRSEDLCLTAVKHNSWYLQYVPDTVITYEMCKIAAEDNARGVRFIPESMYDKELALFVLNSIMQNQGTGYGLEHIPEQYLDYDMCMRAVTYAGENLRYIPVRYKDYDLCLTAVRNKPEVIDYVPSEFLSPEMALAVAKNAYCFKKIPEHLLTEEVCLIAVRHNIREKGTVLVDIPRDLITQKICDQAFETSIRSIKGIPDEYVTEDMLVALAKEAPWDLKDHFPERLRSEDLFRKLIEINPRAEYYIQKL